jgi:hypothetical protein
MPSVRQPRAKTPAHLAHLVPHGITDEAMEERNRGLARRSDIAVITRDDDFDAKLESLKNELEQGTDPFKEKADEFKAVNPGHKVRFLSDKVVGRMGRRGWEPVKKTNGDEVKVANMTLAHMPTEFADIRDEKYRREGADELARASAKLTENQEKIIRDARGLGMDFAPLSDGEVLTDQRDPSRSTSIGVTTQRGGGL